MPNLGALLKQEITRIAMRIVKNQTKGTKHGAWKQRSEIAALKRRVDELEKMKRVIDKARVPGESTSHSKTDVRFVAKGFRTHRHRLGLSMAQMAKLLGASEQSVYNWESGHSKPRPDMLQRIAAVRAMGKREAQERVSVSRPANADVKPKRAKRRRA